MNQGWMQWIGQIAVPMFMLIGIALLLVSGEDAWRICGSILSGSSLIAGTHQRH